MTEPQRGSRSRAKRLAAAAIGLVAAVVVAEIGLRFVPSVSASVLRLNEAEGTAFDPKTGIHELDEELGYRPVLGGRWYSELGALVNDYPLEKRAGLRRVLFLGDSVTRRGRIVDGLRELYGDDGLEYWNGGVEGYNTRQAVVYYERYLARVEPDHVVLSFHMNDFTTTPVLFVDGDGELKVYRPMRPLGISSWALEHSHIYRLWLARQLVDQSQEERFEDAAAEVEAALADLARLTREHGARLSVVVLPLFLPYGEWEEADRRAREEALAILERLELETFDLMPALTATVAEGLELGASATDPWHPSEAFGRAAGAALKSEGLLD